MSEMIERVAAAIKDRSTESDWAADLPLSHSDAVKCARAAIEAMRKPTRAMLSAGEVEYAGESCGEDVNLTLSQGVAEDVYYAMIDAALTPRPKS